MHTYTKRKTVSNKVNETNFWSKKVSSLHFVKIYFIVVEQISTEERREKKARNLFAKQFEWHFLANQNVINIKTFQLYNITLRW